MKVTQTTFDDSELRAWWTDAYADGRLRRDTFFQSWDWNRLWSSFFVEQDPRRELLLMRIEDEGSIVAAAPFFVQTRRAGRFTAWNYLLFLGDRLAQYTDLILAGADERAVWHSVLEFVDRVRPCAWLHLHDVLPDSTVNGALAPGRRERGDVYLRLLLGGKDGDTMTDDADAHMRRALRRARKDFEEQETLHWDVVRAPSAGLIDELVRLTNLRFGPSSWLSSKHNEEFFREAVAAAGQESLFTVLRSGDEIIHIIASWYHGDTVFYMLSGMDERYSRLRPGTMNLDMTIRHAMRSGAESFDFLRGDERYKREFMPEHRTSEHWTLRTARCSPIQYRIARIAQRVARSRLKRRAV